MKKIEKIIPKGGTYIGIRILTTYNEIVKQFGEPTFGQSGDKKVTYEWFLKTSYGEVISIYDWKEYRDFAKNENIWWNVAASTPVAKMNLIKELKQHFATIKEEE